MQSFLVVLAVVLTAFTGISPTVAQSSTPGCIICPPVDNNAVALASSDFTTDPIMCSYDASTPTIACYYARVGGALVTDADGGACPLTTVSTCTSRRKRQALPRSPPRGGSRRAETSETMKMRKKLGSAKHRDGNA